MADTNVKLAQLLLRRKELSQKVEQLRPINVKGLFETKTVRKQISDAWDDITATVPIVSFSQVTQEYDYYASQLRKVDAAIQQANWTTEVAIDSMNMANYTPPEEKKAK